MRELKNPGLEEPKLLEFDEIPSLYEFLAHGGVPGIDYLYVAAENQPKGQLGGWGTIIGVPFFSIGGIGATLMARGKPIKGSPAQPGTSKCLVFADDKILAAIKKSPVVIVEVTEASELATSVVQSAPAAPKHIKTSDSLLK